MVNLYKKYFLTLKNHKLDTIISIMNCLIGQFAVFIIFSSLKEVIRSFHHYNLTLFYLVFSIYLINKGVACFFTSGLLQIEEFIISGRLDVFITRPAPILLQITAEKFDISELVNVFSGLIVLEWVLTTNSIDLLIPHVIVIISSLLAIILYFSIRVAILSIAFWTKTSFPICIAVMNIFDFSKYPLPIFNVAIFILLNYVLPLGFISYIPAFMILNIKVPLSVIVGNILTLLFIFVLSQKIWSRGLKRYDSCGY